MLICRGSPVLQGDRRHNQAELFAAVFLKNTSGVAEPSWALIEENPLASVTRR
jgi:hypothetical protein